MPHVLFIFQDGSWVVVIYIYSLDIWVFHAVSKMAAGWLLFLFIVVPRVLFNFRDGGCGCAMCYSTCSVQVGVGWLLFLIIVVPDVLFNFQDGGWLLFIFKVVPCVACSLEDGGWMDVIYIYSCAMCCMQFPRWPLGAY